MKNTLLKVWGIVLTLAIIAGLLMAVVPVAAGDLSWTTLNGPTLTQGTNANVFAMAADGKTMYLFTTSHSNSVATDNGTLYKSNDAGITWVYSGIGIGLDGTTTTGPVNVTKIVVNQTNSSELLATDGTNVWRSTNAGQNWYAITTGLTAPINGIDDAVNGNGGISLVVSSPTGVYLYATDTGVANKFTTAAQPANLGGSCYGVAFSPNFVNDATVFAFIDNGSYLFMSAYIVGSTGWNMDIANSAVPTLSAPAPVRVPAPARVSFAFPSGFTAGSTSAGKVFIGYSDAASTGYVIRVNTKTQSGSTFSTVTDLQIGSVVPASIAYTGNYSTGTLVVGLVNAPDVYSATNVGTPTSNFSWNDSTQPPYSRSATPNTLVVFSPTSTTLYAGTAGVTGSALSTSTDYNSFSAIAFISVSAYANVSNSTLPGARTGITGATQFQEMVDNSATPNYLLFKSVDSSVTWKLVYATTTNFYIALSPAYATDSTIYLYAVTPSNKLVKSNDGGATWNTVTVVGSLQPTALAAIDANNYWVGTSAGIRASNSSTTVYLDGASPLAIITIPNFYLVWEGNGEFWYSTDNGVTFTATGAASAIGWNPPGGTTVWTFGFNGKNWTIYNMDTSGNMESYTVGVSTAWSVWAPAANFPAAISGGGLIKRITLGPQGVWYLTSNGNATAQMYRTTVTDLSTATPADFEIVSGTAGTSLTGAITGNTTSVAADASKNNGIYTMITLTNPPTNPASYSSRWLTFTDSVLTAPAAVAPAASSVQTNTTGNNTNVDFSWTAINHATRYDLQVAYDAAFSNLAYNSLTLGANGTPLVITGTSMNQISLIPGKTYYWRVRVSQGYPMASEWVTGTQFTTTAVSSISTGLDTVGSIYPDQGSVITGTTLTFAWGSVASADTYEFSLSKDGTVVDSKTGLKTTFVTESNLAGGSQYTWQVRAISGGVAGNWVYRTFTTLVPPVTQITGTSTPGTVVTPTITVVYPTQPTQPQQSIVVTVQGNNGTGSTSTPAWAWIVIAIGAVLVIAVIVLIVRTRKV
jgi:hypothetical protein